MHRPRTPRSRRLAITGVFTGAVLISVVIPALLPADVAGWIVIGTAVAALIAVSQLVWTKEVWDQATLRYQACALTAAMAAILLQILLLLAVPAWTLQVRGDLMSATVTAERTEESSRKSGPDTHNYTLVTPAGHLLSQELEQEADYFDPGDRVTVVVDRWDLIDPRVAYDEVADDGVLEVAASVLFSLMLLMCFVTGGMTPYDTSSRGAHAAGPRLARQR